MDTDEQRDRAWINAIAEEVGGTERAVVDLLVEYLTLLADAATAGPRLRGRRLDGQEFTLIRDLGKRASEGQVPISRMVEMYLAATRRMWRELPDRVPYRDRDSVRASSEAVLRAVGDAIATLVDSYQAAERQMIRREEASRRELIDDLLRGDADVARLVERAQPFGLNLGMPHQVFLAVSAADENESEVAATTLELAILDRLGDRDILAASRNSQLVVLVPAPAADTTRPEDGGVGELIRSTLAQHQPDRPWRTAIGRAYPGAYGIARSYEEAREIVHLAERLQLDTGKVVDTRDMLTYRVLARDQAALVDLVQDVLGPLTQARGGADPLVQTLHAYFAAGGVATEAARGQHMSVRTLTYRLAKIRTLTGHDPRDPHDGFTLHMAVVGARLLQWPPGPEVRD